MMLRRLIVMRHAESSTKHPACSDHARPLTNRGIDHARLVGAELQRRGWIPAVVLSSDAVRTRATSEEVSRPWQPGPPVLFTRTLYHSGIDALRMEAADVRPELQSLLVLGHNPGWEEAVQWLTGQRVTMVTGCAALLSGEGSTWKSALAEPSAWHLEDVLYPHQLAEGDRL